MPKIKFCLLQFFSEINTLYHILAYYGSCLAALFCQFPLHCLKEKLSLAALQDFCVWRENCFGFCSFNVFPRSILEVRIWPKILAEIAARDGFGYRKPGLLVLEK